MQVTLASIIHTTEVSVFTTITATKDYVGKDGELTDPAIMFETVIVPLFMPPPTMIWVPFL